MASRGARIEGNQSCIDGYDVRHRLELGGLGWRRVEFVAALGEADVMEHRKYQGIFLTARPSCAVWFTLSWRIYRAQEAGMSVQRLEIGRRQLFPIRI